MPDIYIASSDDGPLRQGEVLSDVVQFRLQVEGLTTFPGASEAPFVRFVHPLAVVLSQDCDLDWDYKARREQKTSAELSSVLLCEAVQASQLPIPDSGLWKRIKINKDERYHFLEIVPSGCDMLGLGLAEMALDFKRCFSIPTPEVYLQLNSQANRRCRLISPYAEHLSQRAFYFHSRIGLPAPHASE